MIEIRYPSCCRCCSRKGSGFVKSILNLAEGLSAVLKVATPLIPLFVVLAGLKIANIARPFSEGFFPALTAKTNTARYARGVPRSTSPMVGATGEW